MLTIELPADVEARFASAAQRLGLSEAACARQAILNYIDDAEEVFLAEAELEAGGKTLTNEEVMLSL